MITIKFASILIVSWMGM